MKFPFSSRLLMGGLAAVALAAMSGTAQAESIQFVNDSGSVGVNVKYFVGIGTSGADANGFIQEGTTAGYYHITVDGVAHGAYCTDLLDRIYGGETWNAKPVSVGVGLATASYPGGNFNANAIDAIAKSHVNPPSYPAAQLAIWDLVEGSQVQYDAGTNSYSWGSHFSSDYGDLASIYSIEQNALAVNTPSGSTFLKVTGGYTGGRPQDLVYYDPSSPIPEPAFYQMGVLLTGGGLMALRLRRKSGK